MKSIDVVGAVIESDGEILCTQRGGADRLAGLWEFPGGKVESGESPQQALAREIAEELGCEIEVGESVTTTRHTYDFAVVALTTFWCALTSGDPVLSEHAEMRWLPPRDLLSLEWAPADLPAVEIVRTERT